MRAPKYEQLPFFPHFLNGGILLPNLEKLLLLHVP